MPGFEGIGHKESEGQTDLIIAAAACVQFFARITDELSEPGFNVHMDVFKFTLPDKASVLNFLAYLVQTLNQCCRLLFADNALTAKHAGMGLRGTDILCVEMSVIGLRVGVVSDHLCRTLRKTSAPALIGSHNFPWKAFALLCPRSARKAPECLTMFRGFGLVFGCFGPLLLNGMGQFETQAV